jgi:hypothetical protein
MPVFDLIARRTTCKKGPSRTIFVYDYMCWIDPLRDKTAGGGVEYLLSHDSFSHLKEDAFLVPCTQTARPFRVFLKDLMCSFLMGSWCSV